MESQREIERRYNKLLQDVATNKYYKVDLTNRVNCYTCRHPKCGHITKTKDIAPGVTPMFYECEKCHFQAVSSMYNDIAPDQEPTFVWDRPTLSETMKFRKKPTLLDHILRGGLVVRKVVSP
ncbi:hypothetical protein SAMN02927903_03029 [Flavobacterium caeni]|uniref:Uncharacterized protein n=1 Tax=Flavobacterium caeni TaxID=490189 RepID=A0A1G5K1G9_9FLAO|nr:hypothetical protein SAMN02927903_03029 [Flavobacterium caeni]